jgi:hypothetical protein
MGFHMVPKFSILRVEIAQKALAAESFRNWFMIVLAFPLNLVYKIDEVIN